MEQILFSRLYNQGLWESSYQTPYEVVKQLMCIQSQDFNQHLRAIASRVSGVVTFKDIEEAYNQGLIVKTWTQRGTIHCVAAEDAGRVVKLCASKTLGGFAKRRAFLGISDEVADKALKLIEKMLTGKKSLTRKEIINNLTEAGLDMQTGRGYHLLCYAGTLGIVAQGPIKNKDHAFVLLKERVPQAKNLNEEESLKELSLRYFTGHGLATIKDFARWSGLGITQIKKGIELCGKLLDAETIDGEIYYYATKDKTQISEYKKLSKSPSHISLLAGFDEFLLGYKDRTATLEIDHHVLVDTSRNGIFKPTLMIDGKTIATRAVKHKTKVSEITVKAFDTISDSDYKIMQKIATKYGDALEKPLTVTISAV